ncbi:MAG: CocE/NonD family hydrolase [Calditrichaeota bacterium]|nr:CocE/NonD family hydrolase [Calditrichota bacterium]RQW04336.1 MAG: CocE/NonD family hydrolase [Calditrichota bacterium]
MVKKHLRYSVFLFIFSFLFITCNKNPEVALSSFGKYQGFSEEKYDSWQCTSQYLTMHDGVKLAMDIIRPVRNEQVVSDPLPAVWAYYRYHRAVEKDGKILSLVDRMTPLQTLIKHGYVIVVADARGTGASFGSENMGPLSHWSAQHIYQITEWIASQEWCDGNVGMFGHSYSGNAQFLAAAQAPPHLKAVFPSGPTFDLYEIIYAGGIFSENIAKSIRNSLQYWDIEADAVPVDSDSDGQLLKKARLEHRKNVDPFEFFKAMPFRDSQYKEYSFWLQGNPMVHLSACNVSRIPVYQWVGWQDFLIRDAFQWFVNLLGPKKLTAGWWSHDIKSSYTLLGIEQLRWFDYWLKDIKNGIMDEPSIHYICIDDPDSLVWYQAEIWPLPDTESKDYYFIRQTSGDAQSRYQGLLSSTKVLKENQQESIPFPASGELTFTTPPLERNLFVIGHPIVMLNLTTMVKDVDLYVSLQDVNESDSVHQVSDGGLRASHRKESEPSFNNMDLPFHRHYKEDLLPIPPDQPVKLAFDLLPTAKVFTRGHRIRVAISCITANGNDMSKEIQAPAVKIVGNQQNEPLIRFPVVKESKFAAF